MIKGSISSIHDIDFSRFGRYFNLRAERHVKTDFYDCFMTRDAAVASPMRFGITECENGSHFNIDSMERHLTTEEVLFAGDGPIILSVADSDPAKAPRAEDVVSVRLEPGDFVVLARGIWHDACHAAAGKSVYYFLSNTDHSVPGETDWVAVEPEAVQVELTASEELSGVAPEMQTASEELSGVAPEMQTAAGTKETSVCTGVRAVHATAENFAAFGRILRVTDEPCFTGDGWRCWMTQDVCMDQPANAGICTTDSGVPYVIDAMERHTKTEELMVCGTQEPIVVALADSDPRGNANAADVRAFLLEPGEAMVIRKGIWHDACRGANGKTTYYFLSLETDEPAVYQPLAGGAVEITR